MSIHECIAAAERNDVTVGVSVIMPDGERFTHNAERRFVAASTVKIPIMIELFRQIDHGKHALDDRYQLQRADRAAGSGVMLHLHDGMEFTLKDLTYLMISISDNTATNVLIDRVGIEQVNATMRELGMAGSTLSRKMGQRDENRPDKENWATPDDYATAVESLLNGQAASPSSCAQMIAMLEKQQNDRRIARHVPEHLRWGSKTGSLPGVVNDAGFIETARGPMIVSIYCEHPDRHLAEQTIGDITSAALQQGTR